MLRLEFSREGLEPVVAILGLKLSVSLALKLASECDHMCVMLALIGSQPDDG